MNIRYRFRLLLLISILVLPLSVFAQTFSLQSISPADGQTGVSTVTQFVFTFNQPLAGSATPSLDLTGLAVEFELHPSDSELDNALATLSADKKTLTINNVQLNANTQYTLLVTRATSADSAIFAQPSFVTFTTGSALATGKISGKVTAPSGSVEGALVSANLEFLFQEDLYVGFATVDANGNYEISHVPAGRYNVIVYKDEDANGEFTPETGEPIGGYDPDQNLLLDPITLADGENKSGVNMEMKPSLPKTARELFSLLDPLVNGSAKVVAGGQGGNASLVGIATIGLDSEGKSGIWFYSYKLATGDSLIGFAATDHLIVASSPSLNEGGLTPGDSLLTPLPDNWMDSDAAMQIALQNGGDEFLQNHPGSQIFLLGANLQADSLFTPTLGKRAAAKPTRPHLRRRRSFFPMVSEANIGLRYRSRAVGGGEPYWLFLFGLDANSDSNFFLNFFAIAIHMVTGNSIILSPAFSFALANMEIAIATMASMAPDAILVGILADPFLSQLQPDGKALFWQYVFWSAAINSFYAVIASNHRVWEAFPMEQFDSKKPLPTNYVNSDVAVSKAEARGGTEFRQAHPNGFVNAVLAFGLYAQEVNRLVWHIQYLDYALPPGQWLNIFVDGQTGDVIVGVKEQTGPAPSTFKLSPLYPNPIKINRTLHIPLQLATAATVEIKLYNVLGQELQSLFSGKKAAGTYVFEVSKLARALPVGTYFIRARAVEANGQVRIFTRSFVKQ